MKDPRLLEIEFLTAIERKSQPIKIEILGKNDDDPPYGVDRFTFRRMVAHLIFVGHINGPDLDALDSEPTRALADLERRKAYDLSCILNGKPVTLTISHAGRVRLVEMKETLDRNRIRDAFGLLYDQRYWRRDLYLRLLTTSPEEPLSVIACDLDHFKTVNTQLGHNGGDAILRTCFQVVLDLVADRGDSYRRGGDEIFIYLPKTKLEDAEAIAQEIRSQFAAAGADEVRAQAERDKRQADVKPTLSIGVAEFCARRSSDEASKFADDLAEEAKAAGKDMVVARRFAAPA